MMGLIAIYKKGVNEYGEQTVTQQFVQSGDPIPEGWTTDWNAVKIVPEPTEQEGMNSQLMKTNLQLSLTNATMMKQVAELTIKVNALTGGNA